MASLQAPPGHPAQPAALIAAQLAGLKLTISPPDADLKARHQRSAWSLRCILSQALS